MPENTLSVSTHGGLTVRAYRGDGSVLLAFDLDQSLTSGLAGFSVKRTGPDGNAIFLPNRLSFDTSIHTGTRPQDRTFVPSSRAPFQKFRWQDFPGNVLPGTYTYDVAAVYLDASGALTPGATATVPIEIVPHKYGDFEMGFTRGYLSSQGYANRFHNAPFRPGVKTIDFDTTPYRAQYEWLGFHARKMVFAFLDECVADPTVTVDLFAYDLDEPDCIRGLQKLGGRLRAFLDNAPLHTKPGAAEIAACAALVQSAGTSNVKQGHFQRFAHNKVMIQKRDGKAVKVLTGSANFSLRGLYVQANNVLLFSDPHTADLYEQAFQSAWEGMGGFKKAPIANGWFDVGSDRVPPCSVAFSPHTTGAVSLQKVADAIDAAKSTVMYAVMELGGTGEVLQKLQNLSSRTDIFGYGVSQSDGGVTLNKPGQANGVFTGFAYLHGKVPPPFDTEWNGGPGQVIHDKYVVIDFNDANPVVFTGSSNLAEGGEQANGDNLLAITDPEIVTAYAVEAVRLVDHYHFRAVVQSATQEQPLQLSRGDWWTRYYDPTDVKFHERTVFAR